MKNLIIPIGISGSGRTTLAKRDVLKERFQDIQKVSVNKDADNYFSQIYEMLNKKDVANIYIDSNLNLSDFNFWPSKTDNAADKYIFIFMSDSFHKNMCFKRINGRISEDDIELEFKSFMDMLDKVEDTSDDRFEFYMYRNESLEKLK